MYIFLCVCVCVCLYMCSCSVRAEGVVSSQTVVCLIKRHKALGRCSLPGFVSRALCCLFVQLVEKSPLFSPQGTQRADTQRQDCPCILAATKPSYTCQGWHGMEWQVFHGRESWRQTFLPFPFFFSSAKEKMCFSQLNITFFNDVCGEDVYVQK